MRLTRRLEVLERLHPPPPPSRLEDDARLRRKQQVVKRWMRLVKAAVPLVPDKQVDGVRAAFGDLRERVGGPYGTWLRDLFAGNCRLPDLAPVATKDLLLAWLSPEVEGGMVCQECGLEYPRHKSPPLSQWKLIPGRLPFEGTPPWYDLPEFFRTCPHCGTRSFEADWPHLVPKYDRPWQRLDGYVGVA